MYFYVMLFHEDSIKKGCQVLSGKYFDLFKEVFPDFHKMDFTIIEGCIGFMPGKNFANLNAYSLSVQNVKVGNDVISFDYEAEKELDVTNDFIKKGLYKHAVQNSWIDKDTGYYPILCILDKENFDTIRKGTPSTQKASSHLSEMDSLRADNDWQTICNKYEPLEKLNENKEIWDNAEVLYNIAYACSKRGEPRNGMERDRGHLAEVERFRNFSILFYKRCYELEPGNFRYASALGYRYYLNVMELTKPKGRNDGKASEEITQALFWFDKALLIFPVSIKDNYRKGKLIIDKQRPNFQFSPKEWTSETFAENEKIEESALACFNTVLDAYENLKDNDKKRYCNEYTKTLYALGCFYLEKPRSLWNEYVISKLQYGSFQHEIAKQDMEHIAQAKNYFEICLKAEYDFTYDIVPDEKHFLEDEWAISSADKFYRLGSTYLEMFFMKKIMKSENEKSMVYAQRAKDYLYLAKNIGGMLKKRTGYIKEKLACLYILNDDYDNAVKMIANPRDNFIRNTYAAAMLLSDMPDKFPKAESVLNEAFSDRFNKARNMSAALLAYTYKHNNRTEELNRLLKVKFSNSGLKLISLLGI